MANRALSDHTGSFDRQRIDKWLWFARVVKTRTLAKKLALSGHVRLNRVKVTNASATVRVGDVLTITLPRRVRVLRVAAFAERRGPASAAVTLYDDLTPPPEPTPQTEPERRAGARPTKRQRRQMDALRRDRPVR